MQNYGFLRLAAAMPVVHVANPAANCSEMLSLAQKADAQDVSVLAFPELSLCGYSCADLFGQDKLITDCEKACESLLAQSAAMKCVLVFGSAIRYRGKLYNCAIVARSGRIAGIVPKTYLAGNEEFYEPRWFVSSRQLPSDGVRLNYAGCKDIPFGVHQLFELGRARFAVELCQDLWSPVPPSTMAALAGAQLILNLSASNEVLLKHDYRHTLLSSTSARLSAAYLYCSAGYGESTQDLVWAGSSLIYENGALLAENERFQRSASLIMADVDIDRLEGIRTRETSFEYLGKQPEFATLSLGAPARTDFEAKLLRKIEPHPFTPSGDEKALCRRCSEILSSQVIALCTRLEHIRVKKVVIGVSGGLDSTLALIVSALAFDALGYPRKSIIGVSMPGFGTSSRTHGNSASLMEELGLDAREISIVEATRRHFKDIGQDEAVHDLTYENSQARERTQLLMDLAGKEGAIVVGTGDLSELALGWCTYNGDHMSMYGINAGIPKTLVRTVVEWAARNRFADSPRLSATLLDIADTPISPELIPASDKDTIAQKTEDLVGPYELHDFFLYYFLRCGYTPEKLLFLARKAFEGSYDEQTLKKWLRNFLRRFFTQQFKRSCMPDGPKIGSVSLSPRGDWRMPSDLDSLWTL